MDVVPHTRIPGSFQFHGQPQLAWWILPLEKPRHYMGFHMPHCVIVWVGGWNLVHTVAPMCYLDDHEEAELVTFLSGAGMGFARSKKEVICMVEAILVSKGSPIQHVSNGWWESFLKRHPQLCLRKAEKLSYARLKATDPVNDLFHRPSCIFNCDETGMCYQHTPPSVVAVKGQRHVEITYDYGMWSGIKRIHSYSYFRKFTAN